jgi:hypothetical protein
MRSEQDVQTDVVLGLIETFKNAAFQMTRQIVSQVYQDGFRAGQVDALMRANSLTERDAEMALSTLPDAETGQQQAPLIPRRRIR